MARTCKRLGTTAIAVVGKADESGVHVDACDEVVVVEGAEGAFLPPASIVAAAQAAKVDRVHPGFASPRHHLALARALGDAGLRLVGPSPEAIAKSLDRMALRAMSEETFVRWVPGPDSTPPKLADAIEAATAIGYPVVLRADHDEVGLAPIRVDDDDELMNEWDGALAEARTHHASLTVEQAFERARTFEVLVASDSQGETLAIAECETTLRDHGEVPIAESPSPELTYRTDGEALRMAMFETAIRVVGPLSLVGLSSVSFVLDGDARLWVDGVRVGLPRHSAAIEMVTGLDLVAVELALAAGQPMPDEVHTVQPSGHAFFASLSATDEASLDLVVKEFRPPPAPQRQVRFEPSVIDGEKPAPGDGRILTGVGTYAPIRHQALLVLARMLAEVDIAPLRTNARFLRAILADEAYRAGQYDTSFLGRIRP